MTTCARCEWDLETTPFWNRLLPLLCDPEFTEPLLEPLDEPFDPKNEPPELDPLEPFEPLPKIGSALVPPLEPESSPPEPA